jgi:hypothetical protein
MQLARLVAKDGDLAQPFANHGAGIGRDLVDRGHLAAGQP